MSCKKSENCKIKLGPMCPVCIHRNENGDECDLCIEVEGECYFERDKEATTL